MKAVILAAGKGTRMGEASKETPKPMLKAGGKSLLHHMIEILPKEIHEVVLVVSHLKEHIMASLGSMLHGKKITYVEQPELLGTAHALFSAKEHLKNEEKFIVMMGDNVYTKEDLQACFDTAWSMLADPRDSVKGVAKVVIDADGHVENILERYPHDEKGFSSPGVYTLTPEIFNYEMVEWGNGEYGLPQTILSAKDKKIKAVPAKFVILVTNPDDLKAAEAHFQNLNP
ncbi:MAG: nucleotidyltransferase family protein [Patescibacteria group bacterium]